MRNLQLLGIVGIIALLLAGCRRPVPGEPPPLLDTVVIEARNGSALSNKPLESGQLYSLVVSGFISYTQNSSAWMDAQYKYVLDKKRRESAQSLLVNGQALPAAQSNLDQHVYLFYYVEPGPSKEKQPAELKINDDNVRDYSGHWDIRIYDGYLAALPPDLLPTPVYKNPITVEVKANQGWQDTSIPLARDQPFRITSITGQIIDGANTITDGLGSNELCDPQSDCCGPKPEVRRNALIGRVGQNVFLIGVSGDFVAREAGTLQLRLNDCDAGLLDNQGSLMVVVQP